MSHTLTVESALPDTKIFCRNSMPDVKLWCPISVCLQVPDAASHTRIDVSKEPETTWMPSNWNNKMWIKRSSRQWQSVCHTYGLDCLYRCIPEANKHDWYALGECVDIPRFLDSILWPYNRMRPKQPICHHIAHNVLQLGGRQGCVSTCLAQCPRHVRSHRVNRLPPLMKRKLKI